MPTVLLEIIAKSPPVALIGGGIVLLILSPVHQAFGNWGWGLIGLGVLLQVLWLFKDKL